MYTTSQRFSVDQYVVAKHTWLKTYCKTSHMSYIPHHRKLYGCTCKGNHSMTKFTEQLATNWVCTGCSYRFEQGHIHWSNKSSSSYHRWPHVYKRSSNDTFIHRKQPSQKPFCHGIKPESLFQQSCNSKTKLSLSYFIKQSDRQTTRHDISKTNVSRQHTVFHEQFRRSYKQAIRIPTHRSKTYNRQQQPVIGKCLTTFDRLPKI